LSKGWAAMLRVLFDFVVDTWRRHFRLPALRRKREGRGTHCVGNVRKIKSRYDQHTPGQLRTNGNIHARFMQHLERARTQVFNNEPMHSGSQRKHLVDCRAIDHGQSLTRGIVPNL
jgi:hypothetical protein